MKRWPQYLVRIAEALVVLGAVYYEPTYGVRGAIWHEAYFNGMPTSYWRDELRRWEVSKEPGYSWLGHSETVYRRNPTILEQFHDRYRYSPRHQTLFELWRSFREQKGPRILHGDIDAVPVLRELLDDPSPKIRLFAQIGLGMNPKIPGDE